MEIAFALGSFAVLAFAWMRMPSSRIDHVEAPPVRRTQPQRIADAA